MKPTWEREGIQLYLGDCCDVLPKIPDDEVDAVITDPPYPNLKGGVSYAWAQCGEIRNKTTTVGEPWGSDISGLHECRRIARLGALVFCSWQSLEVVPPLVGGDRVGLVTWYKRNAAPSVNVAPHYQTEFVWAFRFSPGLDWRQLKTLYDIPKLQAGCMATERICKDGGKAAHPAQKPTALLVRLMDIGPQSVLDQYMGTGTTGVACVRTGRKFIGIEKEPEYFKIAVERIEKEMREQRSMLPEFRGIA